MTSDEVWGSGSPPPVNMSRVHLIASTAGIPAFREIFNRTSFRLSISDLSEKDSNAFYVESKNLEEADILVVDLDVAHHRSAFAIGYCVARGRSILGLYSGNHDSLDLLIRESVVVVKGLYALEQAIQNLGRVYGRSVQGG